MPHSFIHQPDESGFDLQDVFSEFVGIHDLKRLDIVVAWAKRTGIRVLRDSILSVKSAGATVRAIIGISQGGTSRQALSESLDLFDETRIFHVPGRTFHPKVYLATASSEAMVLVGSHNFTAGGVANNFEAGVFSRLSLNDQDDFAYYKEVADFIDRLCNDTNVCLELDQVLLSALCESNYFPLDDEDNRSIRPLDGPSGEEPSGEDAGRLGGLFSTSSKKLRRVSPISNRGRGTTTMDESPSASGQGGDVGDTDAANDRIVSRWFKRLGAVDAQQPGDGHRSNTMTLVQGGHNIDRKTYFRDIFFGDAQWSQDNTQSGKYREVATVKFEVVVDGNLMGDHYFNIRHTPGYDSGQGNRTTELRWDDSFGSYLQSNPLTGRVVSLEKYENGQYRLIIAEKESGGFVK